MTMKKEISLSNPEKILPWIGAPFMAAWILEAIILLIGFTPYLLFINYLIEVLFLLIFCLSYRNRYKCYKAEPNLTITKYFWVEFAIHILFVVASVVQSAFHVWIEITNFGLNYRHEYFFVSLLILALHIIYMCIDYYSTEKAEIIKCCKKMKK